MFSQSFSFTFYNIWYIILQAFDRETTKLWNIINTTEPFEFKSFQDILDELEAVKAENKHLHDVIDTNITALWEAMRQVEC